MLEEYEFRTYNDLIYSLQQGWIIELHYINKIDCEVIVNVDDLTLKELRRIINNRINNQGKFYRRMNT